MLSIPVFGSFPLPPPPPPMEKSVHLVTMMSRAPFWRRLWMPGKYHSFPQMTDFETFFPDQPLLNMGVYGEYFESSRLEVADSPTETSPTSSTFISFKTP